MNPARHVTLGFLLSALLIPIIALFAAGAGRAASGAETIWRGMYLDATSYAPGDTINIHASAPNTDMLFRLVRLDSAWTEVARTTPLNVGLQPSRVGSFVEYPGLSLAGRTAFTLEGWFHPTLLGGDTTVVAGQFGLSEAAAAIVVLGGPGVPAAHEGRLAAYVSDSAPLDPGKLAVAPPPADFGQWIDSWHHLALTYDGAQVKLYVDGVLAAQKAQTGAVASLPTPFRLGARSEAPGDMTGVSDGRFDSWALWPAALTQAQVEARRQRGIAEDDPVPDLDLVDLYLSFEGPYPGVDDQSHNGYAGLITNHATPAVAGVTTDTRTYGGRALRLNHDQIVDAGWAPTASLVVPPGTPSGMYGVQALLGPDYEPTQSGDLLSVRAVAIRPSPAGPRAPIAVVLPTNTWNAYNAWPNGFSSYLAGDGLTPRSRHPQTTTMRIGGNNSAYGPMGDGISLAYFLGQRRPNRQASPIERSSAIARYNVRAPNSMYLVQWLDAQGFAYDVYSDDDFSAGLITAAEYKVLMPNSHHEYWTDAMLANLTQFLNDGGSVAAPAGNIFTWRMVYDPNGSAVAEVRKFPKMVVLGLSDLQSGIDYAFMGTLRQAAACNGGDDWRALGVEIHLTRPCFNKPFCFGQWEAQNTGHWLWQGSGLAEGDDFGAGRPADNGLPTYAVGHEADTWVPGIPIPGQPDEAKVVILAEGHDFGPTNLVNDLLDRVGEVFTCDQVLGRIGYIPPGGENRTPAQRAGTILYFPHVGGGHVLVVGASATPWALESEPILAGLLHRALNCFVDSAGCDYELYVPTLLGGN